MASNIKAKYSLKVMGAQFPFTLAGPTILVAAAIAWGVSVAVLTVVAKL